MQYSAVKYDFAAVGTLAAGAAEATAGVRLTENGNGNDDGLATRGCDPSITDVACTAAATVHPSSDEEGAGAVGAGALAVEPMAAADEAPIRAWSGAAGGDRAPKAAAAALLLLCGKGDLKAAPGREGGRKAARGFAATCTGRATVAPAGATGTLVVDGDSGARLLGGEAGAWPSAAPSTVGNARFIVLEGAPPS